MKKLSRIGILLQNQTAFLIFCPFVVTKDRFYNNLSRLLNLQAVITSLTIFNTNLGSYHMLSRFYFKRRQLFVTFKVNIVLPTQAAFLQFYIFTILISLSLTKYFFRMLSVRSYQNDNYETTIDQPYVSVETAVYDIAVAHKCSLVAHFVYFR